MIRSQWTWKNVSLPAEIAERLGLEFEANVLAASVEPLHKKLGPDEEPTLEEVALLCHLSDILGRLNSFQAALEVDETLVRLCPEEPTHHYNRACRLSLLGSLDEAFSALNDAVGLGFDRVDQLREDPDLDNMRSDERFAAFLTEVEG